MSNGRKTRLGLLVTTQDRYELSYVALTTALRGIDTGEIALTLVWLDGSVHPNSVAFFEGYRPAGVEVKKAGKMRGMGAAGAMQHGMNLLTGSGEFDWVGMFESDCYFFPDWLRCSFDAASAAAEDGLKVGAVTPLTIRNRLLYQRPRYGVTEVLPASCSLFRPDAWAQVPPASIGHLFQASRLRDLWNIPRAHPSPVLGWDWIFAVALFHGGGYESVTTPSTRMLNCAVPEHLKTIPPGSSYADEFLSSGVSGDAVARVRDAAGWDRAREALKLDAEDARAEQSHATFRRRLASAGERWRGALGLK